MYITTRALVLREVKYKEADKILTVLTEDEGKLTVKARGAYRKSCKFGAATQCFTFSEMTLFGANGRWSINEASIIEQFLPLREDFEALALASYFVAAIEELSDEDSVTPAVLQLALNSLFALSRALYSKEQIKAAFELRLMALSGFEPDLSACPVCGNAMPEAPMLSLGGGTIHCAKCRMAELGKSSPLCEGSVLAMRHILAAEAKSIFSFSISDAALARLSDACEEYVIAQLGFRFNALQYYKSIKIG